MYELIRKYFGTRFLFSELNIIVTQDDAYRDS